ncbi:unnamed protein product [Chrysodeixis includens]|uniref:DUF4802 domain-containing protein n=1 Tax=Chrysodeixis includens TaxID=689277 RepID=A0A9P0FU75_CHRIL|nr:unnamed protein product [Chrysodeixis includens]
MATGGSGAVFFLGTRAHYQVLQQPESRFDAENGNASTETIYQNPSVQELWPADKHDVDNERWGYCEQSEVTVSDDKDRPDSTLRSRRRQSTAALCDTEDMKPALLNNMGNSSTTKCGKGRGTLLALLWSLARRKRRGLATNEIHYLHHIDNALTSCTYRESCRCLECQSRYFECDEDSDDYDSDEDSYVPRYVEELEAQAQAIAEPEVDDEDDDDEVFVDTVPGDNTSTDLLLDKKMSVSSDEVTDPDPEDKLQLEVAAGTPVLLNYLLTHPITCSIQ